MRKFFLSLLPFLLMGSPAWAGVKAAVFPFEIRDISQEGELFPQLEPEDLRRLGVVADELKALMSKDGKYQIVDLTAQAQAIEKESPFYKCDGCETPIAKAAGAELAVTGYAEKLSDALISLRVFARDANTGELKKSMSAEIRGNTDDLWLHGIRYLWKNRFNVEADKK